MEQIRTEEEYEAAMARLDELFEITARSKDEQREFNALAKLIDEYEEGEWPMSDPET